MGENNGEEIIEQMKKFEEYLKYATQETEEYGKYKTVSGCSNELLDGIEALIRAKDSIKYWKDSEKRWRNWLIWKLKEENIKEISNDDFKVKLTLSAKMKPTIFGVEAPILRWTLTAKGDIPKYGFSEKLEDTTGVHAVGESHSN